MAVQFQAKELLHILSSCLQKQHVHVQKKHVERSCKSCTAQGQCKLFPWYWMILAILSPLIFTAAVKPRWWFYIFFPRLSVCHEKDLLSIAEFNSVAGWFSWCVNIHFFCFPFEHECEEVFQYILGIHMPCCSTYFNHLSRNKTVKTCKNGRTNGCSDKKLQAIRFTFDSQVTIQEYFSITNTTQDPETKGGWSHCVTVKWRELGKGLIKKNL